MKKLISLLGIPPLLCISSEAALTSSFLTNQGVTVVNVSGTGMIDSTDNGSYSSTNAVAFSEISASGSRPDGTDPDLPPWEVTGSAPYKLGLTSAGINMSWTILMLTAPSVGDGLHAPDEDDFVFDFSGIHTTIDGNNVTLEFCRSLDTPNILENRIDDQIPFADLTLGTYLELPDYSFSNLGNRGSVLSTPIALSIFLLIGMTGLSFLIGREINAAAN